MLKEKSFSDTGSVNNKHSGQTSVLSDYMWETSMKVSYDFHKRV
jgi:hypothetical protein